MWTDVRLPGWAGSDWALVGLGVVRLLVVLFAVSALYGLVAAMAAGRSIAAGPCGAAVGSHLGFSAFGARIAAACGAEHGAALAMFFLPLPWALVGGLAVEAGLRFAWRRLPEDRTRRVAFAAKLAVAAGIALGIIAGVVSHGDTTPPGTTFRSSLNGGEVWFYSSVVTWFWAWLALRRQGLRVLPATPPIAELRRRVGDSAALQRMLIEGAAAFVGFATVLAAVGFVFAEAVADGTGPRIGLLFGLPVVGFSFGAALADGAMGGALGGNGHTSLFHFGLPAGDGAGAAPLWLFVVILLAPAVVAAVTWRRLERDRPAEEQGALTIGTLTGIGFAIAAWLAALVGRIVLLASVAGSDGPGWYGYAPQTIGRFELGHARVLIAARPNPAAVLMLSLFWGLAGGLGAAFVWASRHHARWTIAGTPRPPSPPPPTPPNDNAWLLPESPPEAQEDEPPPAGKP